MNSINESTKINISSKDAFDLIDWKDNYYDLFPGYSEQIEQGASYYYSSEEVAHEIINQYLDIFNSLEDPTPIYRTIELNGVNQLDKEFLGQHWSFDRQSAVNFAKHNLYSNDIYLLSGKINKEFIDWKETIKAFFDFSTGMSSKDENEIMIPDEHSNKIFDFKAVKLKRK